MNKSFGFLTSSIGRKILMGLTGLFLCSFLVVHLVGNFLLFKADGGCRLQSVLRVHVHQPAYSDD